MNKIRLSLLAWLLTSLVTPVQSRDLQQRISEAMSMIRRANNYWQQRHRAEVSAFWDNAVYHTGNMEACRLMSEKAWLDYSLRWADHNRWMGATETDPSKWRYRHYGETQEHVLFGDWQVCFQTYIDLFNSARGRTDGADKRYMINRAMEVMGYEADSPANDYWWWADALYMVMPVMTKMYKLTGDDKYLDKLYANTLYTDSIMLDPETGLYYRDGKYVYPAHKTRSGCKDFWARGDGWVLAGLAKVLQDLPRDSRYHAFYAAKFCRLAAAVKALQQREGYWTRSMMDPDQAPGPETSGTAFFTYGMLWGVNNGYLDGNEYRRTIGRAWKYLSRKALQSDGRVGYVQPIGEKAIPGQVIDAGSEANFGVGAFLLAGCEYVRYLFLQSDQQKGRGTFRPHAFISGGIGF